MPPPNLEYANGIGIGVGIRDEGATLTYLDSLLGKLREIKSITSASSISIRNIYQGGPAAGQGQPIGETPAEVRVRKTKTAVQEESRQMSLLDRMEEDMAHKERQRAHATADYVIGEGRRATGALKASFDYEERLRQQHLDRVKGMTLEELKMRETLTEGRDAVVTEELMRRKGQLAATPAGQRLASPASTRRRVNVYYDPDPLQGEEPGGKWREMGMPWEERYERSRQVLRGRAGLQRYLPYLEQQIEAHRTGQYRGPLGDIPRGEEDLGDFQLPPEGHPHRGPWWQDPQGRTSPTYQGGPTRPPVSRETPTMGQPIGFADASEEEAAAQRMAADVERKRAKWREQKLEREQKQAFYEEEAFNQKTRLSPREIQARQRDLVEAEAQELAARQELRDAIKARAKVIRHGTQTEQREQQPGRAIEGQPKSVDDLARDALRRRRIAQEVGRRVTNAEADNELDIHRGVEQKLARKRLNEAINERAARVEAEREARERAIAQEMAGRTRAAERAATARGYRSPTEQAALEAENRRAYEERQEAFQRRVRDERRRRRLASENPYLAATQAPEGGGRAAQAAFEALPRHEQDRVIAEQEARWAAEDAQRRAARVARPAATGPSAPDEGDRGVFRAAGGSRPTLDSARKEVLGVTQAANTLTAQFNKVEHAKNASLDMRSRAATARQNLASIHQQAQALHQALYAPAGQRPPYNQIMQQLAHLQQLLGQTRAQAAGLNNQLLNQPGGPGGPGRGGATQSLWQRGLFGVGGSGAGGLAATMLTYQAFNLVQRSIVGVTTASWEAARAHEEATIRLQAQAAATGRLTEENAKLATAVKNQYGVLAPQAADIVGGVARFAERGGVVQKSGELQKALLNIAAGRGVSAQELPTFIELAQNEQGRFAEKYLGQRAEVIFREYAKENRGRLSEGLRDTQASLEKLTASLTEYEREQALANAVIEKGAEYQGAAAARAASTVGQLDRTRAMFDDLGASFGRFLQTNRSIVGLLERSLALVRAIADRGEGLPITGPGGAILSDADIEARAKGAATSGSATFSKYVDRVTTGLFVSLIPVLSAGGAIVALVEGNPKAAGDYASRPFLNLPGLLTGSTAADAATQEGRNQAYNERNRQFTELWKAGRIEQTGGPIEVGTGRGFRVLSQEEAAERADEKAAAENERKRKEWVDEQKRNEERAAAEREREIQLERVRNALERLRDIEAQGPETVGRVAQMRLSENNRYTQTLVNLETVQERVKKQWGALGEGAVQLFTTLETQSLRVELVTARFDSLTKAIENQTKAGKERDELELSTSLTRSEEAGVRTLEARVNAARKLVELEGRRQRVLDVGPGLLGNPYFAARQQIEGLQALGGPGVGLGLESRAQKRIINEAVLDILREFPDATVRNTPWMKDAFSRAIDGQMSEARQAVFDAMNAETLVTREQTRLRENAERLAKNRDRLMAEAQSEVERRAVGRAFDRSLIQQTEGIAPRELAQLGLFNYRNDAIMREAQRSLDEEAEARRAIMEGVEVQKGILYATAAIAASLRSGDMSLLVRVENNARAAVDAEGLKAVGQDWVNQALIGPGAVVQGSKANPYKGLNDKYGRGRRRE